MTYALTLGVLKRRSLPSLVQEEIERMIRERAFLPGEALREVPLAAQLGVSRGPIREAFRALEGKGLVRVEKNRGVFVRAIDPEEADEIYEVRNSLERLVIARLARAPQRLRDSGLPALLERAEASAARVDFVDCHALNVAFHERLAECAGSAALLRTYRRLVDELSLFRLHAHERSPDASSLSRSVAEHRALHDALVAGDEPKAWDVLERHVEASRGRMQALLKDPTRKTP